MEKGICPQCNDEKDLVKTGLCRSCNGKAVAAKKKAEAAASQDADDTAEQSVGEPELKRGNHTRSKRKTIAERRSYAADPNATDPNYVYYLATENPEKPGRVASLEEGGYEVVTKRRGEGDNMISELTSDSSGLGSAVSKPVGNNCTGVLMRRRKDIDAEDRALIEESAKRREEGIFGKPRGEHNYQPKDVPVEVGSALYQTKEE